MRRIAQNTRKIIKCRNRRQSSNHSKRRLRKNPRRKKCQITVTVAGPHLGRLAKVAAGKVSRTKQAVGKGETEIERSCISTRKKNNIELRWRVHVTSLRQKTPLVTPRRKSEITLRAFPPLSAFCRDLQNKLKYGDLCTARCARERGKRIPEDALFWGLKVLAFFPYEWPENIWWTVAHQDGNHNRRVVFP